MTFDKLIETVSAIVADEKIEKHGLILTYVLPKKALNRLNEEVFYKTNPHSVQFIPADAFDVEIAGILVKFSEKNYED
jgi:hypothetical protein